jgi:hypothetical protein
MLLLMILLLKSLKNIMNYRGCGLCGTCFKFSSSRYLKIIIKDEYDSLDNNAYSVGNNKDADIIGKLL